MNLIRGIHTMTCTNLFAAAALSLLALLALPAARTAAEPAPSARPAAVDLRPAFQKWGLQTRAQGRRGTCSVFTLVGALEYAVAAKRGSGAALSVEFLNWAGHRAAQRRADGGFFSELWRGFQEYGICPEATLPYRDTYDADLQPDPAVVERAREARSLGLALHWIKEWDVRTGLTEDHLARIRAALAAGHPVCGGLRWPKQPRWEEGVLQMCGPEAVFDGHSVLLVGYREDPAQPGGGVFLIRNSGGDSRDGCLPYAYVRAYLNDALWIY